MSNTKYNVFNCIFKINIRVENIIKTRHILNYKI